MKQIRLSKLEVSLLNDGMQIERPEEEIVICPPCNCEHCTCGGMGCRE